MGLLYICDLKGEWFDFIYIFSQLLPGLVAGALGRYVLCGVVKTEYIYGDSNVRITKLIRCLLTTYDSHIVYPMNFANELTPYLKSYFTVITGIEWCTYASAD